MEFYHYFGYISSKAGHFNWRKFKRLYPRARDTRNHGILKGTKLKDCIKVSSAQAVKTQRERKNYITKTIQDSQLAYETQYLNPCIKINGSEEGYELPMVRRLIPKSRLKHYESCINRQGLAQRDQRQVAQQSELQYEQSYSSNSVNRPQGQKCIRKSSKAAKNNLKGL